MRAVKSNRIATGFAGREAVHKIDPGVGADISLFDL
jgi:hypothetical protein